MTDYNLLIKDIREQLKLRGIEKLIGFCGGADSDEEAKKAIEESFEYLRKYKFAAVAGGTTWGVPKYATLEARKHQIPCISVFAERGRKYALENLEFPISVESKLGESEWGDETEVFVKLCNGVIMIEGGIGTAIELCHIMKMNESRLRYQQTPVYLAPLDVSPSDSKNIVKAIPHLPIKEDVLKETLPSHQILTAKEASQWLAEKIELSL